MNLRIFVNQSFQLSSQSYIIANLCQKLTEWSKQYFSIDQELIKSLEKNLEDSSKPAVPQQDLLVEQQLFIVVFAR